MRKKVAIGLLSISLMLAGLIALIVLNSQAWVEMRLKSELAARGIEGIDFHVGAIGTEGITLNDIDFGRGLTLESLTVGYRLLDLFRGEVREIETGMLVLKHDDVTVTLGSVQIALTPAAGGLNGTWKIVNIVTKGAPLDIPPLTADGTLSWKDQRLKLKGDANNADGAYRTAFRLDYPVDAKEKAFLIVESVTLPWQGGRLRARNVQVALFSPKPINVKLELERVSLNTLLQQALKHRATATGVVSGVLPVTIGRDGSFTLRSGKLAALNPGTVKVEPTAIPGDNQQVEIVRNVLSDFHYDNFSLALESGKNNQLSMLLSLSGNNPAMYNGREVKLNVHLTGDVLSLFQQSLRLSDPQKLLRETR